MLLDEITDEQFADFDEIEEYLDSLPDEERKLEEKWMDSIALAITQGKNVVPMYSNLYDWKM